VIEGATPAQAAVLTLKFILELGALGALAVWGARTGPFPVDLLLAVLAPVATATVWALYAAPRADRRLAPPRRLALELVVLLGAAVALAAAGAPVLAAAFALVVLAVEGLLYRWGL
jgi:Protein of unknown function (DUF2568)